MPMMRKLPWIFSILFLAAVVWTVTSSSTFQGCVQKEQNDAANQHLQGSAAQITFIYRPCIGGFVHNNAEGIIAIFTIILAFSTIFLWAATRDLVHAGRNTASIQLRAYVHNRQIEWKAGRRIGSPWGDDIGWTFSFEWHNSGPTRARRYLNHVSWNTYVAFEGDLPPEFVFDDTGQPMAGPVYIPPEGSTWSEPLYVEAAILEAVRVKQLRLFVWGWCTYRDIFPQSDDRETQFCFELNRVDGDPYEHPPDAATKPTIFFSFRSVGRHNCADEDCNQEA
jgi:hypothetical protein